MHILRWYIKIYDGYIKIYDEYIKMSPDINLLNPYAKHKTEHRRKNFKNLLSLMFFSEMVQDASPNQN